MKLLNKFKLSLFLTLIFYSRLWASTQTSTQKTFGFISSETSIIQLTEKAKSSMPMSHWLFLKQKVPITKNVKYLATITGTEELTLSIPQLTIGFEIKSNSSHKLNYYSNRVGINYTDSISDTELWENIQKTLPKKTNRILRKQPLFSFFTTCYH